MAFSYSMFQSARRSPHLHPSLELLRLTVFLLIKFAVDFFHRAEEALVASGSVLRFSAEWKKAPEAELSEIKHVLRESHL